MATIGIHYVNAALKGAIAKGIAPEPLLKKAGIQQALLSADSRVYADQMTRLVQGIWQTLGDEFMGFTASPCKNGVFALMADFTHHTHNLGALLREGCRFYNAIGNDIAMSLSHEGDQAVLAIKFLHPELDPDHFYREFWLVIWHRFASWYLGESVHLTRVDLDYPLPDYEKELRYLFRCKLNFDQTECRLVFNRSYLEKPLIRSKLELKEFLTNSPADLMTIPGEDQSLAAQIQRMILKQPGDHLQFPKIEELARMLNTSPQTLHRRLIADGTNYQQIKNLIRRDVAITKLVRENCSVDEVSRITGFAEPSSFTRAFKQWTGMSPREYRKSS